MNNSPPRRGWIWMSRLTGICMVLLDTGGEKIRVHKFSEWRNGCKSSEIDATLKEIAANKSLAANITAMSPSDISAYLERFPF